MKCWDCSEGLADKHARRCASCGAPQDFRRFLQIGNTSLSLIIALASVATLFVSETVSRPFWRPEVQITGFPTYDGFVSLFVANNRGGSLIFVAGETDVCGSFGCLPVDQILAEPAVSIDAYSSSVLSFKLEQPDRQNHSELMNSIDEYGVKDLTCTHDIRFVTWDEIRNGLIVSLEPEESTKEPTKRLSRNYGVVSEAHPSRYVYETSCLGLIDGPFAGTKSDFRLENSDE